jgi:hypothetical protein
MSTIASIAAWLAAASIVRRIVPDSKRHLAIVIAFGSALTLGQVLGAPRLTYPLDSWTMYATPRAPTSYYTFVIVGDVGVRRFPFDSLNPLSPGPLKTFTMHSPITWRIVAEQSRCNCLHGDRTLDALIEGLVAVHAANDRGAVWAFELRATSLERQPGPWAPRILYRWQVDR